MYRSSRLNFLLRSFLVICAFLATSEVRAANLASCAAQYAKRLIIDPLSANYQGQSFFLKDSLNGNKPFIIGFGDELGSGFNARVYKVSNLSYLAMPESSDGHPLVAKVSHGFRWKKVPKGISKMNGRLRAEFDEYQQLKNQLGNLWTDPVMHGKESVWEFATFPVVKIHRMVETAGAVILIKPQLKGMSIGDIAAKYGTRVEDLPPEMRQGLSDIYDIVQSVYRKVSVPDPAKPGATKPYAIDMRPENLMWIDDPGVMKVHGLKKPGFVFVEVTQPGAVEWRYHESRFSLKDFESNFEGYLEFNR